MAGHPYTQDMPPAGGFETLRYKRNLPTRGPSAYVILAGVTASMLYGCYVVAKARIEQKELEREKAWSRIYLTPLLMAEADRDAYRRQQIANAREAAIMSKVPGWSVGKGVYNKPKAGETKIGVFA